MSELRIHTSPEIEALRLRYQTSLYLMATEALDIKLDPAQVVLCDFFVQKNPNIPIGKLDPIKERLLLYPRLCGKSFVDALDCVNWIICYPNIMIAIQTADDSLASAFVGLAKQYFVVPGWDGTRSKDLLCPDGRTGYPIWEKKNAKGEIVSKSQPNKFHKLFPEHCIPSKYGAADNWTTPARYQYEKDPTCFAISIESNNSGWHCNVLKNDDILTDNNIRTPERVEKIDERFHMSRKLLIAGGYRDTIGTRYNPDDTYGRLMKLRGIDAVMPYGYIQTSKIKYLCMPAWWKKGSGPEGEEAWKTLHPTEEYKPQFLPPDIQNRKVITLPENVVLLNPERLPFEFLADDMELNVKTHASQYLNNPQMAAETSFTREEILKSFINPMTAPRRARRFMVVDLAYVDEKSRDFTVIAIGDWHQDCLYIVDIIAGQFRPEEMGFQLVQAIRDYRPEIVGIEDINGSQWLKPSINLEAERLGVVLPRFDWIQTGNVKGSQLARILSLVPVMKDGRLKICNDIQCGAELLIEQFIKTNIYKNSKRDIPDAISRLLAYRANAEMPTAKEERRAAWKEAKERDHFNMIFGEGRYAQAQTEEPDPDEPEPEPACDPYTGLPTGDLFR